ncbi:uncharacterized protein LOC126585454 [Malus sylvestris]|uniref:uncharacterized protein LOC126585454 n=1 Tax=Malus sylvestris TaxID=3752 RepID=UPI0021AC13C4|nr:uncharacterized protein LOC126585454 [Malus sylvestris]
MINNYQDTLTICREYGHPDLFITFTCNFKWPEFENKPGFKPEDRPDIISRIFKMKLDHMIDFIKSGKPFGEVEANSGVLQDVRVAILARRIIKKSNTATIEVLVQWQNHSKEDATWELYQELKLKFPEVEYL